MGGPPGRALRRADRRAWTDAQTLSASTDVGDVKLGRADDGVLHAAASWDTGHSWQFAAQLGMSIGHKSLIFAAKRWPCPPSSSCASPLCSMPTRGVEENG